MDPGHTVKLIETRDRRVIGQATADDTELWVTTDGQTKLEDGRHRIVAIQMTPEGRTSRASGGDDIRIDTTPPELSMAPVVTRDPEPRLAGEVDLATTVTVLVDGHEIDANTGDGRWWIPMLPQLEPGEHEVVMETVDRAGNVTILEEQISILPYTEIHGRLFHDKQRTGEMDADDPPLEGWTVFLDENGNGRLDEGEPYTPTAEDGSYVLPAPTTGDHVVAVLPPDGWRPALLGQTQPSRTVTVADTLNHFFDFDDLAHDEEMIRIGPYERDGFRIALTSDADEHFTVYGPDASSWSGSYTLSRARIGPDVIVSRPDGQPFSLLSLTMGRITASTTLHRVDWVAVYEDGSTHTERLSARGGGMFDFELDHFADIVEARWEYDPWNFSQMTDLHLKQAESEPLTGVDFGFDMEPTLELKVLAHTLTSDQPVDARLTRAGDLSEALQVSLASSDPDLAAVPQTVLVPADEASTTFQITHPEHARADGLQTVTISAETLAGFEADATFNTASPPMTPTDLVVDEAGAALVVGRYLQDDRYHFALSRVLNDGTLDTGFGENGLVLTSISADDHSYATAVALDPQGRIIVGGYFGDDGPPHFAVARYHADGSLDESFGNGGVFIPYAGEIEDLIVLDDGSIIVGGTSHNGFVFQRYHADGSYDFDFGSSGTTTISPTGPTEVDGIYAMALQDDGRIVAVGRTATGTADSSIGVVRLTVDGEPDESFGDQGLVLTDLPGTHEGAYSVAIQDDGGILVGGQVSTGGSADSPEFDLALLRYRPDGQLDSSFGEDGVVVHDFGGSGDVAHDLALGDDGRIFVVGQGDEVALAAAFDANGNLLQSDLIDRGPDIEATAARAIAMATEDRFIVAGPTFVDRFMITEPLTASATVDVDASGEDAPAQVVGRHVFYNNSAFDDESNDDAIAPDKQALLPGETATFANYTSYVHGINGVMVDIADLAEPGGLSLEDFTFHVGNSDDVEAWGEAPKPIEIDVRAGDGIDGADRIELIWEDGAVAQEWLQVTVLATDVTGLVTDDIFYFGNAIGSTGHDPESTAVGSQDRIDVRDNPHSFLNPADIDNPYDMNRDGRVGAEDRLIVRDHPTSFLSALRLISVPGLEVEQEPIAVPALATQPEDADALHTAAMEPAAGTTTASSESSQPSPARIAAYFDRFHRGKPLSWLNDEADNDDDRHAWWQQYLDDGYATDNAPRMMRVV